MIVLGGLIGLVGFFLNFFYSLCNATGQGKRNGLRELIGTLSVASGEGTMMVQNLGGLILLWGYSTLIDTRI
jgi:hypothetical protein